MLEVVAIELCISPKSNPNLSPVHESRVHVLVTVVTSTDHHTIAGVANTTALL